MTGNIICGVSFHHSTARGSLKTCKKSSLVHQEAFSIKNGTVFCSFTLRAMSSSVLCLF